MLEVVRMREVDENELRYVEELVRDFGEIPTELIVVFISREEALDIFNISVDKVKAIKSEDGYLLLVAEPDKPSLWRELASIKAVSDPEALSIWAAPERYRDELSQLLSMALYKRVVDLYIARKDVNIVSSLFNPSELPVEVDDVKRSLVYTLGLDATVSIAIAGFKSVAEELYMKIRRTPLYDIYTRFRNFVINNFKFEYIYNYLNILVG